VLTRTIAVGALSTRVTLARVAEATLRDELRGSALLDDDVRAALAAARAAGDGVGARRGRARRPLPAARRPCAPSSRRCSTPPARTVYVRTSATTRVAVTVVGRSAEDGEDEVDLWHEMRRLRAAERGRGRRGREARGGEAASPCEWLPENRSRGAARHAIRGPAPNAEAFQRFDSPGGDGVSVGILGDKRVARASRSGPSRSRGAGVRAALAPRPATPRRGSARRRRGGLVV
jgi:hypothetical protein